MRREDLLPLRNDEAVALLRELVGEVRGLRADLRKPAAAAEFPPDPLLKAIIAAIGPGIAFSCVELIEKADAELLSVTGSDPRALGQRLSRCPGVSNIGKDATGVLWMLD